MTPEEQEYPERVPSGRYMRLVAEDWFTDMWWLLAIPVGLCLIAGSMIHPIGYSMLPVLLCLVIPMAAYTMYLNYSLTPEAVACVRRHRSRVEADGAVTLEFAPDGETGRTYRPFRLLAGEVSGAEFRGPWIVLRLRRRYRYIFIPNTAENAKIFNLSDI